MLWLEKLVRDRSGILLILAGAALILWNICCDSAGFAADGIGAWANSTVCSPERVSGQALQEKQTAQEKERQGLQDRTAERQELQDQTAERQELQSRAAQAQEDSTEPAGCLQLAGSSSMEKYAGALAESFMEMYPDVAVTLQFTGSSAGIAAAAGGSADIGMSSRYLTEEEKAMGAVENIVGFDGIAICANPANGIGGLTSEQLSRLYTGEIRNWSELGGSELPVVPIGREAGSGTRNAFEERLGLAGQCTYANELDSTGAVMARIEVTPGAVGYVSLEAADRMCGRTGTESGDGDGIAESEAGTARTALMLDGAEPSMENIKNGSYPLYRPFIMVTNGEAGSGNELVRTWLAYVGSEEGRRIAEKMRVVMRPEIQGE